jgi:hypothetical protein
MRMHHWPRATPHLPNTCKRSSGAHTVSSCWAWAGADGVQARVCRVDPGLVQLTLAARETSDWSFLCLNVVDDVRPCRSHSALDRFFVCVGLFFVCARLVPTPVE